jgi:hypothetical protein
MFLLGGYMALRPQSFSPSPSVTRTVGLLFVLYGVFRLTMTLRALRRFNKQKETDNEKD